MIRPATAADCAAIAALWNPMIRDTLVTFTTEERGAEVLEALLAQKAALDHPFLVAEEGGPAGLCHLWRLPERAGICADDGTHDHP